MKILVVSTIIILICILCGLFLFSYVLDTSTTYTKEIDEIKTLVSDEHWSTASSKFESLSEKWESTEKFWKLIIEHEELDNISLFFYSIKDYLQEEEKPHVLAELSTLKFFINHIMEKEKLTIQNIF